MVLARVSLLCCVHSPQLADSGCVSATAVTTPARRASDQPASGRPSAAMMQKNGLVALSAVALAARGALASASPFNGD